ncbi:meteorin-like protein [Strongylocentrotus purpuratus]|uniref:Meteorin-like protein n=1 Tax=Strongylocentrotus purpuratus TaxID=7668 RepID=A0A7M7REU4_STRPU|nr:meteorin-like protein [Strongylocentrotus purpuratus]|eukprot:XP_786004.2 PREDICTED: meteorin-like protein [Strongylocentrotus purpuratus]
MLHDVRPREDNRLGDAANGGCCTMENCNGKSRWIIQKLLAIATTLLLFSSSAHGLENDLCNWTGSGLEIDAGERSIQQLNINCQSGHISWSYPRNALHITFSNGKSKEHFRLCLNIKIRGNGANIYRETPGKLMPLLLDDRPEFERNTFGKEVHVHDILERIQYERTSPKEEHCFAAKDGKAIIYIEAAPNPLSIKYETTIDYRIEELPLFRNPIHHVRKECRKCEGGEIVAAFCSSDFAIKGRMLAVTPEESTRETYINVAAGMVYRQRDPVFLPGKHSRYYGLITTPTRCGVKKLEGHYLMTGQIVLGRAQLGCMAHLSVVKKVAREVDEAGISPCDLTPILGHNHHRYIE